MRRFAGDLISPSFTLLKVLTKKNRIISIQTAYKGGAPPLYARR